MAGILYIYTNIHIRNLKLTSCKYRSNGKRGWFPSNYVEILRQEGLEREEQEPDENEVYIQTLKYAI